MPADIESSIVAIEGNRAELTLKQGKNDEADLIVIPSHNNEIEDFGLDFCAAKVVRHSKCSVMVVK